jgi:hypothetical protein
MVSRRPASVFAAPKWFPARPEAFWPPKNDVRRARGKKRGRGIRRKMGPGIRVLGYLRKRHGAGRWRKLTGVATVRLPNGALRRVELHWYEAHGIGRRDMKIKCYLDVP